MVARLTLYSLERVECNDDTICRRIADDTVTRNDSTRHDQDKLEIDLQQSVEQDLWD